MLHLQRILLTTPYSRTSSVSPPQSGRSSRGGTDPATKSRAACALNNLVLLKRPGVMTEADGYLNFAECSSFARGVESTAREPSEIVEYRIARLCHGLDRVDLSGCGQPADELIRGISQGFMIDPSGRLRGENYTESVLTYLTD